MAGEQKTKHLLITNSMKNTIHSEGAKFNLYTLENIPNEWRGLQVLSESFKVDYFERFKDSKIEIPEGLPESIKPVLMFECRKQLKNFSDEVELYHIERAYTVYETPKGRLATAHTSKGKTHFSPYYGYFRLVHNIEYSLRGEMLKPFNLGGPNQIGKFTEKKVCDWLNYVDSYIDAMEQIAADFEAQKSGKKTEIEEIVNQFKGKKGVTISTYKNSTTIQTPLFYIDLTLLEGSNYLDKKIRFEGKLNDVVEITNLFN